MTSVDFQLVIFDMDGTLTRANINFDEIRTAIGIPEGPILEALANMSDAARMKANLVLRDFEDRASETSELQPHAAELVSAIRESGRPVAIMTRNSRRSVEIVTRLHGLEFDFVRTRDDGVNKPKPDPVLDICRALRAAPESTWVIGDFHYDIVSANAAGAISVHLAEAFDVLPDWSSEAHHVVRSLREFSTLLGIQLADAAPS